MYIGYFTSILSNILSAFNKKHSKLIFALSFVFMWVLYFGNTSNPDLLSYENIYNEGSTTIEIGFRYLIDLSKHFNINFKTFVCIMSLVCLLLVFSTIRKFTSNTNYVMAFYFFYPFVLDVIQLRNFMAISIVIFAMRFLLINDKKNKLYYIMFICLAGSIHKLMFAYIIFIFINLKNKNRLIKILVVIDIIFCIYIFFNGNNVSFITKLLPVSEEKYTHYFSKSVRYGFLYNYLFTLINVFLLYVSKRLVNSNWVRNEKYIKTLKFVDLIFWANILSISFFPFYMMNVNFYRLYRNLSILNYTVYAITNDSYIETGKKGRLKYNLCIILGISIIFIYDVGLNYEYIFKPIFENNIFLGDF